MPLLARQRLVMLLIVLGCVLLTAVARPLWRGKFAADVEMTGIGGNPLRLGVHSGVGNEAPASPAIAPPQLVIGNVGSPFEGPTPAEKAAIANVRAAVHEQWALIRSTLPNRMAAAAPEPVISQPFRHLTPWEIDELNRNASQIRSSAMDARRSLAETGGIALSGKM